MKEEIYNLYLFLENDEITNLGCQSYILENINDDEKTNYLAERSIHDYRCCKIYELPGKYKGKTLADFTALARLGAHFSVFESIFQDYNASMNPLFAITMIVNGVPRIDLVTNHNPLFLSKYQNTSITGDGIMIDYLETYIENGKLNIKKLIHDDYFNAINLLIKNNYFISAIKLILSFIDTIAFVEFGDSGNVFIKWLDKFSNLNQINTTSEELWEFRNSVLHMTNIDSRKHRKKVISRISFYMGNDEEWAPKYNNDIKHINFIVFLKTIEMAVDNWILSYQNNIDKVSEFVKRYDQTLSDYRVAKI